MTRLKNKVAIITGGARGMGESTARLFAAEGAKVVVADLLESEGQALANELGEQGLFVRHDVTDEASWQALIEQADSEFGTIDILINNAGIVLFKRILDTTKEEYERVLNVNLVGSFLGVRMVGEYMIEKGNGSIINISSVDGLSASNSRGAYASSKWGVRGLTQVAAMEFGPHGVRVNSIHPGGINTVMSNPTHQTTDEMNQLFHDVPMQRIGEPEEVSYASLFLASDESRYITGEEIKVDGGMIIGRYTPHLPGAPNSAD